MRLALAFSLLATPALADVAAVVNDHILPGTAGFAAASDALAQAARADCRPDAVAPAWHAAMDAWVPIGHLRLGPQEQAALTIAYWSDDRGAGRRVLARMIADQDPMGTDATAFAQVSAAARGLYALESMLYDPAFNGYAPGSYACTLVAVMAEDLAHQAQALDLAWRDGFAQVLISAGEAGNAMYLSPAEAQRALFTQLHAGIEFIADQRLGRPLGLADRPRPQRAENWRSGRGLRNVTLSLASLHGMATALAGQTLASVEQAFATADYFAATITDPSFQDVDQPQARLRVESLQGRVRTVGNTLITAIGEALGVAPGFNSLDGD